MKIAIEHVCFVLAILNALTMGLILTASIIMLCTFTANVQDDTNHPGHPDMYPVLPDKTAIYAFAGAILAIDAIVSLISFIFSVLLCNGLCKRRLGQIKAYFIYGVVTTLLVILCTLIVLFDGRYWTTGLLWLLWCVIHSMFLVLVHKTYQKLAGDAMFKNHVRLLER